MRFLRYACTVLLVQAAFGQLTPEQKEFDFRSLANLFAKRYGPYEWKRDVIGFDGMKLAPWLDRVARTTNDLEFYQVMVDYVGSFRDSHDAYLLPSTFSATLGIGADLYDGKVYIDNVNRSLLPQSRYPFAPGDELVSIDGRPMAELIEEYAKYRVQGSARAQKRRAIEAILTRAQSRNPLAAKVGATASVVVRRQSTGAEETVTVPWSKSGLPIETIGPVQAFVAAQKRRTARTADREPLPGGLLAGEGEWPAFGEAMRQLQHSAELEPGAVLGMGARAPIFAMPEGFEQRLGRTGSDYFYSGVYKSGDYRIGFIRVPTYGPASTGDATTQFRNELTWMQENTDGLVIDQMRNGGGSLCYAENIVASLMKGSWTPLGYEIRATWEFLMDFYSAVDLLRSLGAPASVIEPYQLMFDKLQTAYLAQRGRTEAVPVCTPSMTRPPWMDSRGNVVSYQKPVIMLADEFSISSADAAAAMFQDNRRGLLVGYRTNGAGGSNSLSTSQWQVGAFSEGTTGMTLSLMVRKEPVTTPDYPESRYIENVGVRPDVELDYMTLDNLLNQGKGFVGAFTEVLVKQIEAARVP